MIPKDILARLRFVPPNTWVPTSPLSSVPSQTRKEIKNSLPLNTPHPNYCWYWFGAYSYDGRPVDPKKGGVQRFLYKTLIDPQLHPKKRLVNHLTTSVEDVNPYKAFVAQPKGSTPIDNRKDISIQSMLDCLKDNGITSPREHTATLIVNILQDAGYQPTLILKLITNLGV